jgi:hypothetical protein
MNCWVCREPTPAQYSWHNPNDPEYLDDTYSMCEQHHKKWLYEQSHPRMPRHAGWIWTRVHELTTEEKLCDCDWNLVLRQGCRCGGK